MKISSDVVEKIINFDFLKECRSTDISIILLDDVCNAEKNINSRNWENFFLEKRGDLTAHLLKYEPEIFKEWNELSKDSKEKVIPIVEKNYMH